ncbi:Pre-mRNA-splicing factor SLU7 [Spathaspora sp. JA1]|nr:Pre-mRNA-splicing factor SLU7 [Spathaspora sp. JA1]
MSQPNQYIPKYITSKPWYQGSSNEEDSTDYLSHHRKNNEIIDHSIPQTGQGIKDSDVRIQDEAYDSKRDRWYGYTSEEWLARLENWTSKEDKEETQKKEDEPDYELELIELDLFENDLLNIKQHPLEKLIRDRNDIPGYIHNITSNPDNKIRLEFDPKSRTLKDPNSGFINDQNQFVKKLTGQGKQLTELQRFAGEFDQDSNDKLDLNNSIEASPTLMMMKLKQQEAKRRKLEVNRDKNGLIKSRYSEDVHVLNHTAVYGSYYESGKWGYACCKLTDPNSVCTNSSNPSNS